MSNTKTQGGFSFISVYVKFSSLLCGRGKSDLKQG